MALVSTWVGLGKHFMDIFQSSPGVGFVDCKSSCLDVLLGYPFLCGLVVNSLIIPELQQLVLELLHLRLEAPLVIDSKLLKGIFEFFDLMPKHADSISISPDSFFIGGRINLLHNILYGLLNIVPSRVQVIHMHLQVFIGHLAGANVFGFLDLEVLEMIFSHLLDNFNQFVVEIVEKDLLLGVVIFELFWVFFLELILEFDDFSH